MGWLALLRSSLEAFLALRDDIKAIAAFFKKAQEEKWFERQVQIMQTDLPKAKSREEFQDVAGKIQDQIKGL